MANTTFPTQLGLGGIDGSYTGPQTGVDTVPWNGPSPAVIVGIEPKMGGAPNFHPQFRVTVILKSPAYQVKDEKGNVTKVFPSAEGAKITGTKPIEGKDAKGKDLGRNIADMLVSAGVYTIDQINSIIAAQKAGQMPLFTPDQIIQSLMGRNCFVDVGESWSDDGKAYSNIDNFLSQAQHDEAYNTPALYRQDRSEAPKPSGKSTTTTVGAGALGAPVVPQLGGGRSALGPIGAPMGAAPAAAPQPFTSVAPAQTAPQPFAQPAVQPTAPATNGGLPTLGGMPSLGMLGLGNAAPQG